QKSPLPRHVAPVSPPAAADGGISCRNAPLPLRFCGWSASTVSAEAVPSALSSAGVGASAADAHAMGPTFGAVLTLALASTAGVALRDGPSSVPVLGACATAPSVPGVARPGGGDM